MKPKVALLSLTTDDDKSDDNGRQRRNKISGLRPVIWMG
jgi:hypothetical protein